MVTKIGLSLPITLLTGICFETSIYLLVFYDCERHLRLIKQFFFGLDYLYILIALYCVAELTSAVLGNKQKIFLIELMIQMLLI